MPRKSQFRKGIFRFARDEAINFLGPLGKGGRNGQSLNLQLSTQEVPMVGGAATVTVTNARPGRKQIVGISARVLETVTGAGLTTLNIGDGTDADRYGAAIAVAAGTVVDFSNATADPKEWLNASGNIVFTAVAGVISTGRIRLDVFYLDATAPTS